MFLLFNMGFISTDCLVHQYSYQPINQPRCFLSFVPILKLFDVYYVYCVHPQKKTNRGLLIRGYHWEYVIETKQICLKPAPQHLERVTKFLKTTGWKWWNCAFPNLICFEITHLEPGFTILQVLDKSNKHGWPGKHPTAAMANKLYSSTVSGLGQLHLKWLQWSNLRSIQCGICNDGLRWSLSVLHSSNEFENTWRMNSS